MIIIIIIIITNFSSLLASNYLNEQIFQTDVRDLSAKSSLFFPLTAAEKVQNITFLVASKR